MSVLYQTSREKAIAFCFFHNLFSDYFLFCHTPSARRKTTVFPLRVLEIYGILMVQLTAAFGAISVRSPSTGRPFRGGLFYNSQFFFVFPAPAGGGEHGYFFCKETRNEIGI